MVPRDRLSKRGLLKALMGAAIPALLLLNRILSACPILSLFASLQAFLLLPLTLE